MSRKNLTISLKKAYFYEIAHYYLYIGEYPERL